MAAQGRAEGSESLGGISRAHKCSAQLWATSFLLQKGNGCSDLQPWLWFLVTWCQIILLSLAFLSWFVFQCREKAAPWRGS